MEIVLDYRQITEEVASVKLFVLVKYTQCVYCEVGSEYLNAF